MKSISEETRAEAWLAAVKHLTTKEDRRELNLVLEILRPDLTTPLSKFIEIEVDKCLKDADLHPLQTVAETIFPATEYKKYGPKGVFEIYPKEVFPLIKSGAGNIHGTYAHRLVRGFDYKGN